MAGERHKEIRHAAIHAVGGEQVAGSEAVLSGGETEGGLATTQFERIHAH